MYECSLCGSKDRWHVCPKGHLGVPFDAIETKMDAPSSAEAKTDHSRCQTTCTTVHAPGCHLHGMTDMTATVPPTNAPWPWERDNEWLRKDVATLISDRHAAEAKIAELEAKNLKLTRDLDKAAQELGAAKRDYAAGGEEAHKQRMALEKENAKLRSQVAFERARADSNWTGIETLRLQLAAAREARKQRGELDAENFTLRKELWGANAAFDTVQLRRQEAEARERELTRQLALQANLAVDRLAEIDRYSNLAHERLEELRDAQKEHSEMQRQRDEYRQQRDEARERINRETPANQQVIGELRKELRQMKEERDHYQVELDHYQNELRRMEVMTDLHATFKSFVDAVKTIPASIRVREEIQLEIDGRRLAITIEDTERPF